MDVADISAAASRKVGYVTVISGRLRRLAWCSRGSREVDRHPH